MLTRQRQQFIDYYLIGDQHTRFNATQSAIKAGYKKETAYSMGSRLLKDVEVKNEVDRRLKAIARENKITKENVLKKLWDIANNGECKENDRIRALEVVSKIQKYHKDSADNKIAVFQQIEKEMADSKTQGNIDRTMALVPSKSK